MPLTTSGKVKLALTGFHGSGKTTAALELCSWLKKKSITANLVSGSARSSHGLLLRDFSLSMHLEVVALQIVSEIRSMRFSQFTICDRSLLDFLAYGVSRSLPNADGSDIFQGLMEFSASYLRTYSKILILRGTYGNSDNDPNRTAPDVSIECYEAALDYLIDRLQIEDIVVKIPCQNGLSEAKLAAKSLLNIK